MLTNKLISLVHISYILSIGIGIKCSTFVNAVSPYGRGVGWMTSRKSSAWSMGKTPAASPQRHGALALNLPRGGDNTDDSSQADADETKRLVIIIDVDNTLYSEQDLLSSMGDGIEAQIVRNTHLFGLLHFNLTPDQCDELYKKYGSTIEGLRHTLPPDQVRETMARFYREVYDPIDFSCLLGVSKKEKGMSQNEDDQVRSGYDHGHALQRRRALAEFLQSICSTHPVYLASNSPKGHIHRAINSLGLGNVNFAGVLSPDIDEGDESSAEAGADSFPTKSSPGQYYKHVLDRFSPNSDRIILLDDSLHNLREAESVGIEGIHTNQSGGRTLDEAIAEAMGHILPAQSSSSKTSGNRYTFSDVDYLLAKNKVDTQSINPSVWKDLAKKLAERIQQNASENGGILRIADLGAGMLSMLQLILEGGGEGDRAKLSMLELIKASLSQDNSITKLEYFGYESNLNLLEGCKEKLQKMGFQGITSDDRVSFTKTMPDGIEVAIHLRPTDYQNEQSPPKGLDLVIGCCFADLFDPSQLALSMQKFAHGTSPPLVYFPITFTGTTQFDPTYPSVKDCFKLIPSDTSAFQMYAESLSAHGHNLDPTLIVNAISGHGGSLISKGTSDWIIDPLTDKHLFETMIYFFGMSGAREIAMAHLDSTGWIQRCRIKPRTIVVSNIDLLFQLKDCSQVDEVKEVTIVDGNGNTPAAVSVQEIQFVAPYKVTTVTKQWDTTDSSHLSPDQVEIESLSSLISSGTELKIFKGTFDSESALDENIDGMADKSMEYPLAYGYSLVGRIVACGSNVDEALLGRLAFTFSPHSSRVIVDIDAMQLVPHGISAEDAVFMPSVETALSLVHDAHIRVGENVAVYGQGLIGLLVTSILSMQSTSLFSSSDSFGSVTACDVARDRLIVASSLGATSALHPSEVANAGPFDVSIEVSGNPRALQSAIDHTSNHGRIVVGSWYGNTDVALKLGIDFHRSHKTIQTSQVSSIPPTLTGLWSKERRFSLTWALVKSLQPSRLITKRLTLDDAQEAYEALDGGKEVVVCFKYDMNIPRSKL